MLLHFKGRETVFFGKVHEIRESVFVKEQNVPYNIDFDKFDRISTHFILMSQGKAVATARIRETEEGTKLERFAVAKKYRGNQYGKELMKGILEFHKSNELLPLYLHAQEDVIGFYKKFGFVEEGKIFHEANIPHRFMKLEG